MDFITLLYGSNILGSNPSIPTNLQRVKGTATENISSRFRRLYFQSITRMAKHSLHFMAVSAKGRQWDFQPQNRSSTLRTAATFL